MSQTTGLRERTDFQKPHPAIAADLGPPAGPRPVWPSLQGLRRRYRAGAAGLVGLDQAGGRAPGRDCAGVGRRDDGRGPTGARIRPMVRLQGPWFAALLGLLALNILAATLARFPWRRGHRGFLLTHAGVLVLLAGAMATFWAGAEGQLILGRRPIGRHDPGRPGLQPAADGLGGAARPAPRFLSLSPDRPTGRTGTTLKLHEQSGMRLEVLKFYRHARADEQWVARFLRRRPPGHLIGAGRARTARPWSSSGSRPIRWPTKSTSVPCA